MPATTVDLCLQDVLMHSHALATDVSGVLPIANGGTNKATYNTNDVPVFDGTSLTGKPRPDLILYTFYGL